MTDPGGDLGAEPFAFRLMPAPVQEQVTQRPEADQAKLGALLALQVALRVRFQRLRADRKVP
eukprot:CAMPEP_0172638972 /NCGR_PEP_ID=MMETSP1068-20121228/216423_1 /TAXON_ID=35684 /ORGANISM="Pseudopedinella elastica, Strain CCMP716" /LENGTH=61 /DNA_ID=CAMNT_0013451985 /DNA_START=278 /DNA_END=462 /DNA_ORIENTATION=+